ncbi:MAG: alpha/beta hydrolase family protein [Actinomycetes bacterium]
MRTIETPVGEARAVIAPAEAVPGRARSVAGRRDPLTLVLGHGAGGGIEARDLVALAEALPPQGVTVVRVEQPWRVAGRKVATPPATLDVGWRAVLDALSLEGAVVVGGRSAGARVACRTALSVGAVGCLALAFPLHPPGRPEKSRLDELTGAGVPALVVQGDRDAFGGPDQFPTPDPRYDVRCVPFADHSLRVPASAPLTQREALSIVVDSVSRWLRGLQRSPQVAAGGRR